MTEQRERVEKALRACAEHRVPDTADPWPAIRERALAGRRSLSRPFWRVPRTRLGWAFVALLVMLFGTGAYAVSEVAYDLFRSELPGAVEEDVGVPINQRQVAHGAAITLERVYADAGYVVVSFNVDNLKDEGIVGGRSADLVPVFDIEEPWYEKTGGSPPWPSGVPHVDLTDGSGREFRVIDAAGGVGGERPQAQSVVFAAQEPLDPTASHRFRFEVPLQVGDNWPPEPVGEPLIFDFDAPVQPTPIVEVDQQDEASGLRLTLERVVESPGRPYAVICFDPPDERYVWEPLVQKTGHAAEDDPAYDLERRQMTDGCWAVDLSEHADSYSLTIPRIFGFPRIDYDDHYDPGDRKTIRGPWTFDFEVSGK